MCTRFSLFMAVSRSSFMHHLNCICLRIGKMHFFEIITSVFCPESDDEINCIVLGFPFCVDPLPAILCTLFITIYHCPWLHNSMLDSAPFMLFIILYR